MNLWKKGVAASLSLLLVFSITPVHAEDFESYDGYDDDEDYDEALYWQNKTLDCLQKRGKALDKRLWLRGYY